VEKNFFESLVHSKARKRVTKKKACASIVLSKSRASIEPRESERERERERESERE
jgi:hypothetical protein